MKLERKQVILEKLAAGQKRKARRLERLPGTAPIAGQRAHASGRSAAYRIAEWKRANPGKPVPANIGARDIWLGRADKQQQVERARRATQGTLGRAAERARLALNRSAKGDKLKTRTSKYTGKSKPVNPALKYWRKPLTGDPKRYGSLLEAFEQKKIRAALRIASRNKVK
tara:strand:- start:1734 stop:2243 length:510 start_codon:yes stop_codon:yes gene_type:complete